MCKENSVFTIRWLVLSSILAITITCQAEADPRLRGKFVYCGPASPIMIDWLCRSIDYMEKHGVKEGYLDPKQGYIPLSQPAPFKRSAALSPASVELPPELDLAGLMDESDPLEAAAQQIAHKRGIHAHVAMSLCCRRMCDARVFCRGYKK